MSQKCNANLQNHYLIIGAGPVGLGLAKVFKDRGIRYDQAEADSEVGGNWYHGVYKTAHILSCKTAMEFPEYPMPESYPDFPSQNQVCRYFIDYAHHFDLYGNIMFRKKVVQVLPVAENLWQVSFADGEEKKYTGVLICNGHHWCRRHPACAASFTGEYFHSKDYNSPEQLVNKKTLVIGAGNSACDIVCESARVGAGAFLSMRRSVWIFPKTFMGKPLGRIKLGWVPPFLEKFLIHALIRCTFGKHAQYKLDKPAHGFFDRHPTVSEELPYYLRHGRVTLKPDVLTIVDQEITFTDGTKEQFDLIVAATGFDLAFPFLPKELVRGEKGHLHLYGHATYEDYKGLYFVGWQQVRGGVGSLMGVFANVIADFIEIEEELQLPVGKLLKAIGEKCSSTHLMGARQVFRWVKSVRKKKLQRKSYLVVPGPPHRNKAIAACPVKINMEVY
ncbi:MAG: NAD(P)-binding domain-containing protein [Chitinophagaceae bacterium]|nr:NAD(P)-binding domain-containing protein [Chitinophagaceae bacterium]